MKHAYCILAHHNWWQLKILLHLLDDEKNVIFLHVDKIVNNFNRDSFLYICKSSTLRIYQDVICNWGGYSIVECELRLFQHAYEESIENEEHYAFYHLISGSDLPLRSQTYIHSFPKRMEKQIT